MSLLEEARVAQKRSGPECQVVAIRSTLDDGFAAEYDELIKAVVAGEVQQTSAREALRRHQITLKKDHLADHLHGRCSCHS